MDAHAFPRPFGCQWTGDCYSVVSTMNSSIPISPCRFPMQLAVIDGSKSAENQDVISSNSIEA